MSKPLNKCSPCGEDFKTLRAFDEHRVGFHAFTLAEGLNRTPPREDGRRCLSVDELVEAGWTQDDDLRWQVPTVWEDQRWRWELDADEVLA